jgi:tetratricopeptide (TPR) repeat protein
MKAFVPWTYESTAVVRMASDERTTTNFALAGGAGRRGFLVDYDDETLLQRYVVAASDLKWLIDLAAFGADTALTLATRRRSLSLFELELTQAAEETLASLEMIVFSREVAPEWNLDSAVDLCQMDSLARASDFFADLRTMQEDIARVQEVWSRFAQVEQDLPPTTYNRLLRRGFFSGAAERSANDELHDDILLDAIMSADLPPQVASNFVVFWKQHFDASTDWAELEADTETPLFELVPEQGTDRVRVHVSLAREAFERVTRQISSIQQLLEHGDLARARTFIEDLVRYQTKVGGPFYLGRSLSNLSSIAGGLGQPALAVELAERACDVSPNDPRTLAVLAEALKSSGLLEEALATYNVLVERSPLDTIAAAGRAEVLKSLGRIEEAVAAYDKALELDPDHIAAANGRASALRSLGRLNDALAAYTQTLELHPNNTYAANGQAATLKVMGRLDEALAINESVLARSPDDQHAARGRADTLKAMGRLDEAVASYDALLKKAPRDNVALNGRAQTLRAMGRLDDALSSYGAIVEAFPFDSYAANGRAGVLKAMGRLDDALWAFDQTLERFSSNVVAMNGRAETLKGMGRLADALEAYEQTLERFPDNVVAANGRAGVLRSLGRYSEALSAYDEILRTREDNLYASNGRAETLKSMGRLQEALDLYSDLLARNSNDLIAANGRASVLRAQGRMEDALTSYEEISAQFPFDERAAQGVADTLKRLGRLSQALAQYDTTLHRFPGNVANRNARADALKRLGRLDEALQSYESIIDRYPYDAYALHGKADVLKTLDDLEGALTAYKLLADRHPFERLAMLRARNLEIVLGRNLDPAPPTVDHDTVGSYGCVALAVDGLIRLRKGDSDTAAADFRKSWKIAVDSSQNALLTLCSAVERLSVGDYQAARALTDEPNQDAYAVWAVLRAHALAATGSANDGSWSDELSRVTGPREQRALGSVSLLDELEPTSRRNAEERILREEVDLLLLTA